jgi:hypothetical protein
MVNRMASAAAAALKENNGMSTESMVTDRSVDFVFFINKDKSFIYNCSSLLCLFATAPSYINVHRKNKSVAA